MEGLICAVPVLASAGECTIQSISCVAEALKISMKERFACLLF